MSRPRLVPESFDPAVSHWHPIARPGSAGELAKRMESVPLARSWDGAQARAWWQSHLLEGADRALGAEPLTPATVTYLQI